MPKSNTLSSVQALFPQSANKSILVSHAWRPKEGFPHSRPAPNGADGWSFCGREASHATLAKLAADGYTWVNLEAGNVADNHKDAAIADLIAL